MNNLNKGNKYLFKKIFSFNILKKGLCVLFCFLNSFAYLQKTDTLFPQKYYFNSGKVSSEGTLENGLPTGLWRNYYESGTLRSEGQKQAGKSTGIWIFYLPNGKIEKRITYGENLKNGSYQQFDSLGKISLESWYKNDTLEGISKSFKNGKLKTETSYAAGKKDGVEKVFDEADGRLIETIYYNKDEVASKTRLNQLDSKNQKTGLWRTFYPDGKLMKECLYENGKETGKCKEWNKGGTLIEEPDRENGKDIKIAIDIRQTFHPNGQRESHQAYLGNLKHGVSSFYDSTGILLKSEVYTRDTLIGTGIVLPNGNYDSNWVFFYPDLRKSAEGKYKNGVKTGLWKYFDPEGKVIQRGIFRRGMIDGEWNWYYANGQVRKTESYINGRREGLSVEFDSLGTKLTEGNYLEDVQNGPWFYFKNNLTEVGEFNMGLKTGPWRHYYHENKLIFEGTFKDGVPLKKHYYYFNNGRIKYFGKYKKGVKNGDWREYNQEGLLLHVYTYRNGRLISIDGDVNNTRATEHESIQ